MNSRCTSLFALLFILGLFSCQKEEEQVEYPESEPELAIAQIESEVRQSQDPDYLAAQAHPEVQQAQGARSLAFIEYQKAQQTHPELRTFITENASSASGASAASLAFYEELKKRSDAIPELVELQQKNVEANDNVYRAYIKALREMKPDHPLAARFERALERIER